MEAIIQSALESVIAEKLAKTENQIENLALQFKNFEKLVKELLRKSNPEEKLTVREAAEILKVKENTVRDLCRRDKIAYEKFGCQYRIKRSAITEYLNRI
ncbi:helix-turn-helix domain-containing protein [uncultured Pontibacter sp.]|uniref:helix-turn-helix domain-containing protein n=1 Tax=uncultured Pontibacter sp. TaxID=453356 RepID=UPI002632009E|nr:helix-turn-helix domain-containing protein [uncultured Pontibacter sp.]